ncbi:periplasmic chaperone for outer membrane proteins Skp [Paracoccus thiocyanatus]|uniref:Periplasmic chaperone for outer membrane proteins Skp n=1 Tax=Paracoccus thiocyanatus TaxID=34006 RepID=A0A1N6VKH4_9RHOB|nr:OmpH family outer membrane protein [Paracoccus thiocyanatus]SIQ78341.1 periplasmic chaperone for outer membrane proteins Skp [Paracoccus thiocyanatus]
MAWRRGIAALAVAALLAGAPATQAQPVVDPPQPPPGPANTDVAPMVIETPPSHGEGVLPVLTLDQEALYLGSQWGQRAQAELERNAREVAAENDRLADQFAAEEQELTALRQSLPPDEFRKRADEFDQRAVEVRRARDAAARALHTGADEERQAFFRAALPVLAALMRERGAVVVLDQRAIFVASQSIDVTDELVERMDREIGAGPAPPETGAQTEAAPQAGQDETVQDGGDAPQAAPAAPAPPSAPTEE